MPPPVRALLFSGSLTSIGLDLVAPPSPVPVPSLPSSTAFLRFPGLTSYDILPPFFTNATNNTNSDTHIQRPLSRFLFPYLCISFPSLRYHTALLSFSRFSLVVVGKPVGGSH